MKKEHNSPLLEISSAYVETLKKEADKALAACKKLNKDPDFIKGVPSIISHGFVANSYSAELILLRDIITLFGDLVALNDDLAAMPVKAKFLLIFFFEKFQGKDLSEVYGIEKLNQLTASNQFDKNCTLICSTSIIPAYESLSDVFLMPLLLAKIKSEETTLVSSFINRVASLVVKADGMVSEIEESFLKKITEKVYRPKLAGIEKNISEISENDSLELVLNELNELIGMDNIKQSIKELTNFLTVQKLREEKGLKTTVNSLHAVFMGPPGTGKTTVARSLGRILKHLGFLSKGHLVETDRSGMVAGYVGQTAIKADEIINTALGGVLFIDEAYSLHSGSLNDFGNEAIEILLKRMEDKRKDFVVVVAGYPDEMEMFIQSNPGLQSRFNRYFKFDHFEADALMKIFKLNAEKADFVLTEEAEEKLSEIIERVHEKRHKGFGNARVVRNLFEKIIEHQANRIVSITPVTEDLLKTISEEDVPDILKTVKEIIVFDGE